MKSKKGKSKGFSRAPMMGESHSSGVTRNTGRVIKKIPANLGSFDRTTFKGKK